METLAQEELKAHLMATDEHFRELCRAASPNTTTRLRGAGSQTCPYRTGAG